MLKAISQIARDSTLFGIKIFLEKGCRAKCELVHRYIHDQSFVTSERFLASQNYVCNPIISSLNGDPPTITSRLINGVFL